MSYGRNIRDGLVGRPLTADDILRDWNEIDPINDMPILSPLTIERLIAFGERSKPIVMWCGGCGTPRPRYMQACPECGEAGGHPRYEDTV